MQTQNDWYEFDQLVNFICKVILMDLYCIEIKKTRLFIEKLYV